MATPAQMLPLTTVRLLDCQFAAANKTDQKYLRALEPDRLLALFFREPGLETKARPYGNWESTGLVGTRGDIKKLRAATMIAAGAATPDGELKRWQECWASKPGRCQQASVASTKRNSTA